jgi:hypothetical protein
MKYYTIESVTKNKTTDEVVGSGSFLVKVDSEDEVKAIIQEIVENQASTECFEDDFMYHECSEEIYVKFKEDTIIRHAKSFYYERLMGEADYSLSVREYNKIKYSSGNEAKAVDYYLGLESAFKVLKKDINLEEISAKKFLDKVEALATQN